jgi:hypothetical protein
MLTAEIRVPDYTGPVPRYAWKKKTASARNEALDNRGTSYAALQALGMTTALQLNREAEKLLQLAEARKSNPAASPRSSVLGVLAALGSGHTVDNPWL